MTEDPFALSRRAQRGTRVRLRGTWLGLERLRGQRGTVVDAAARLAGVELDPGVRPTEAELAHPRVVDFRPHSRVLVYVEPDMVEVLGTPLEELRADVEALRPVSEPTDGEELLGWVRGREDLADEVLGLIDAHLARAADEDEP
jgi:hypothetical protein